MLSTVLALSLWSAPVIAAEHRVGASVTTDFSSGLVTGIDRFGLHGGAGYALLGERHGLVLDLGWQDFGWGGVWERFPSAGLGWTTRWGAGEVAGYHVLGAAALLPGTMEGALAPLIPSVTAEAGVELAREGWWLRAGGRGFMTFPALAAGAGARVSAGLRF